MSSLYPTVAQQSPYLSDEVMTGGFQEFLLG
jgi:hypothetical protein